MGALTSIYPNRKLGPSSGVQNLGDTGGPPPSPPPLPGGEVLWFAVRAK